MGEVRARWSVSETKRIERSPGQIEMFVADAVTEALDIASEPFEPRRWRTKLRRPLSMFDQCEITISLADADDDSASNVDVVLVFEASTPRVGLVLGLTTSIVGIPVGVGWRWYSTRAAKAEAKKTIAALWHALDVRLAMHAYR